MRLPVCVIFLYLSAVASAFSAPTLDMVTYTASATMTAAPAPTTLRPSLVQYRTVTSFSTPAAYSDFDRYVAVDTDGPVFRKRLYSDRLSLAANYANAREITISLIKDAAHILGNFLLTIDYGTIGNIVFRAAVRSLTPGYQLQLLDAGPWQQVTFDVATSAYMKESFPQLPASPGAENTNALDLQLPTQLPSLTDFRWGVKYILAHMDASALISLGLKAAVSYFDLDATIDTANAMVLIDIGMRIVFRSHASVLPFHKFGDVLKLLDTVFPSLELPSLVSGLPHPPLLPFKPAEDFLPRYPVRFTRPPPSSETEEESIVSSVYFSENPEPMETKFGHRGQLDADHQTKGLSGYVIFEDSAANNVIRDALHIVIVILATGGVVISTVKMIDGFRKAEQAKQDFIKLHALKSLAYLPWERRVALLNSLAVTQPSRPTQLASDYDLAIAPDIPEAQIVAHIIRLVCALSHERRKDFVYLMEIAFLPLPSPSTPPDPDDPVLQVAQSPSTATMITSPSSPLSSVATPPPPLPPPTPPPPPSSSAPPPPLPPTPPPPPPPQQQQQQQQQADDT